MPFRYRLRSIRRNLITAAVVGLAGLSVTYYAYAYPFGVNHTTEKDAGRPGMGQGCWCHSAASSTATVVAIESDQSSFEPNQTYTLRLTVRNASLRFAGFNIAAKLGRLGVAESGTTLMSGELTHSTPRILTSGLATWTFKYTAPTDAGTDTIYATGNAVNGNGQEDAGDQWSFSPKFVVHVGTAAVSPIAAEAAHLRIWPNPSTSLLHVDGGSSRYDYRVLDALGRTVLSGNGESKLELSIGQLPSGSYTFEKLEAGKVTSYERFVK
jgi:hypothetical protein